MGKFNLISVLAVWSCFVGPSCASQSGGITIVAIAEIRGSGTGNGGQSSTHTVDSQFPHAILPTNTASVTLQCQARFPVMWTLKSLDHKWVNGTDSQRTFGNFHDPSTYEFVMTLKLGPDWQLQGQQNLTCVSVTTGGPVAAVLLRRDASLGAFVLTLSEHPSEGISRQMSRNSLNLTLSMVENVRNWGRQNERVTCRVLEGTWPGVWGYQFDLKVGRGVCDQPLMCLTENYKVETDRRRMDAARVLDDLSLKVESIDAIPTNGLPNPILYTCQAKVAKERAHLLVTRNDTFAWLEYQIASERGSIWRRQTGRGTNITRTLYVGDAVRLRCRGSPFFYAKGAPFQFEFKNGTDAFARNDTENPQNFEISLPIDDTNLTRISCQFPPWNSTEWVTVSMGLDVEASSPPISPTDANQNISFYSKQGAELNCDFTGTPPPKFEWNITSEVYSVKFSGNESGNATVTVSAKYLKSGGLGPIPAARFSCVAYNVAANGTKYFDIQATRSFAPAMSNTARQAVVMYTGDLDIPLNCSLTQGVPAPTFKWELHGVDISHLGNGNHVQRNHGNLETELVLKKVSLDDEAEFTCIASNFLGSVRKEFSVRIRERSLGATAVAATPGTNTASTLVTIALVLILGSIALLAYRQVKQSKKIWTLETVRYTKREEEAGANGVSRVGVAGVPTGDLLYM